MGLIKLLVFIAVVFAALTLWRRLQSKRNNRRSSAATTSKPMVRCSQCQVHLPEDRAVRDNQRWYCCAEHRDADHHD
ncbi:MAG: hypothetical protein ACJAXR_000351 [Halopseudomonas sp.]|jgi:uncharacterized protein|uniref:PP0621 family protein n=1 Tax=Halopseudomonas sp. TaxID=2901191 RepID=UPI0039E227F1